ncbi:MAG: hypothetical protein RLZZ308_349, partial [Candidatus Parcubacteria bacterium]
AGSIPFITSGGLVSQDNTKLFFDATNDRLGIGTSTPLATLDVKGDIILEGSNRYINFGLATSSAGYGFRDNNGVLEIKNSLGGWTQMASTTLLSDSSTATTSTSTASGLMVYSDGSLGMLRGCSNGEVLRWNASTEQWECKRALDQYYVVKTANETSANTTQQNDDELSFSVKAGETWVFKFDLMYNNNNSATPDFAASILGDTGWTCNWYMGMDATVFGSAAGTDCDTAPTSLNVQPGAISGQAPITIQGEITATTDGTVQLRWAQRSSSAGNAVTIYQGSSLQAKLVGGVDLAEMYYSKELDLVPGTVVTLDSSITAGVKKSTTSYDKQALGIVSTKPGFILSDASNVTDTPVLVALAGRVPVFVTTENGDIAPGDLLTTSNTSGYAMKATKAGQVIGQAMTGLSGSATGTVLAFIKTSYYNGTDIEDLLSTENATTTATSSPELTLSQRTLTHFLAKVEQLAEMLNISEVITDRLSAALEVITPKILTGEVSTNKITSALGSDVEVELSETGAFTITSPSSSTTSIALITASGDATFTGSVTSQSFTSLADILAQGNLSVSGNITSAQNLYTEDGISTEGIFTAGVATSPTLQANALTNKVSVGTTTGEATFLLQATTDKVFAAVSQTGSSLFSITNTGMVGVGTTTASSTFAVQASEGASPLSVTSSSGASFLTMNANGFLGLGTSTASALLDVWGNLRVGTGTLPMLMVNTATNIIGIGNDGTAIDDEVLRVSGRIRATGFDIDTAADLAEKFEAIEAMDAGIVVAFSTTTKEWAVGSSTSTEDVYTMSTVRKARVAYEAIGVVSTNPGIILGKNVKNGVPVAFQGRVPVKVTAENGEVKQGDYLTVSETMPGYAMKLTGEGKAIGRALSDFVIGKDKVLMLVENSTQRLDIFGRNATTTGMLTTGNIDLNANGVAITNIKSLASANGTWSIDENGRIVAKVLCLEDLCIDKSTLTNILNVSGQQGTVLGTSTTTEPVPQGDTQSTSTVSTTTEMVQDVATATSTPEVAESTTASSQEVVVDQNTQTQSVDTSSESVSDTTSSTPPTEEVSSTEVSQATVPTESSELSQ